jgi:hypothetical protein
MASDCGLAYNTLHHIMADVLQYSKTCHMGALCINRWWKNNQTYGQFSYIQCYNTADRKTVCIESLLVMREQSFFSLTSEQSTVEWEQPSSPRTLSASKVLGSVFWIQRMYRQWTSWNMDVQLTPSSDPHWKACHRPSRECPSLLSDGVILLHDNAWPHTAQHSTAKLWIRNAGPYSPDLHPLLLYISHLEWALVTTLFRHYWRHQAC